MAAVPYPADGVPTGRPVPGNGRRKRLAEPRGNHLRLVEAPLFDDAIFKELKEESEALSAEWSVWRRPMPVIPRPQIVTNYVPFEVPTLFPTPVAQPIKWDLPLTQPEYESVAQEPSQVPSVSAQRYRLRRFVACVALGFAIFGGLSGATALAGNYQGAPVVLSGSARVSGGYEYKIQSGDTLWSIASRVYPNGDPRALVTQLEAQLHGATPTPGDYLRLP